MATDRKTVPIAYITKWATTAGIAVRRDVEISTVDPNSLWLGQSHISPKHWTEDKAEAEKRWRAAVRKEAVRLRKRAEEMEATASGAPKYDDKAGE